MDEMFVTTARKEDETESGDLFRVKVAVKGVKESRFNDVSASL